MPELDTCHFQVASALSKAEWVVDPTPLHITDAFGNDLHIDLTASRPANGRQAFEIGVEVKCFTLPKKTPELHRAIGQCVVYKGISEREGFALPIYMAVPESTYSKYFNNAIVTILKEHGIALLVVDLVKEEIVRWSE